MDFNQSEMRPPFKIWGPDSSYVEFENIYCCGSKGILLSTDGKLIDECSDEHIYWLPLTMSTAHIQEDKTFNPVIVRERRAALNFWGNELKTIAARNSQLISLSDQFTYIDLSHPFGWYAFGHFFDSFQRLFSLKDHPDLTAAGRVKFLVSRYDRVKDFMLHLSILLGRSVAEDELLQLQQHTVYRVPRLVKPTMRSVYTNFTDEVYAWVIEKYRNYFGFEYSTKGRLYLTRNHVKPGMRGVVNEEILLTQLIEEGFTVLNGSEPLEDIIEKFSSAGFVVGPHGSLLANTMFCGPDTKILEYCPRNRPDFSFLKKTKLAKNYVQKLVDADEKFNIELNFQDVMNGSL